MKKIELKLDRLDERLDKISITLTSQAVTLKEHVRRTNIAEQRIDSLGLDLKPIQRHVSQIRGVGKFIGLLGTLSAIAAVIYSLMRNP